MVVVETIKHVAFFTNCYM